MSIQGLSSDQRSSLGLRESAHLDAPVLDWLETIWNQLIAAGHSVQSARDVLSDTGSFADQTRWDALAHIEQRYRSLLDSADLYDAGLYAIESIADAAFDKTASCMYRTEHFVLAAVLDLSPLHCKLIERTSTGTPVSVLVPAPEEEADSFDQFGKPIPQHWTTRDLPNLDRLHTEYALNPIDQATLVADLIASEVHNVPADSIAIICPDDTTKQAVSRAATYIHGFEPRFAEGVSVGRSRLPSALELASNFLHENAFEDYLDLVRTPLVTDYLDTKITKSTWLEDIHTYAVEHAPRHTPSDAWPSRSMRRSATLQAVWDAVQTLLQPLSGATALPREWAESIRAFLGQCLVQPAPSEPFSDEDLETDRVAAKAIHTALDELHSCALHHEIERTTAVSFVLERARLAILPEPVRSESIDVIGYLEMLFSPAQTMFVLGMNDGTIPSRQQADPVLTPALRTLLNMQTEESRHSRDAVLMSCTLCSSQRVHAIAGSVSDDGDPLLPSRLLLQRAAQDIPAEFLRFTNVESSPTHSAERTRTTEAAILSPLLDPERGEGRGQPIRPRFAVTWFRDYLQSPYEFYLKRVLKLKDPATERYELGSLSYGNLLHDVMERFFLLGGGSETDLKSIESITHTAYEQSLQSWSPDGTNPAVLVQLQMTRHRLDTFVRLQHAWAEQGWRIAYAEWAPSTPNNEIEFNTTQHRCMITGRIDRIDFHEDGKRVALFDYKTGNPSKAPDDAHRQGGNWIDLQLPLYRHLAQSLTEGMDVQLGYITFPRLDAHAVPPTPKLARWTREQLVDADETAQRVIDSVLSDSPGYAITDAKRSSTVWTDIARSVTYTLSRDSSE